MGCHPWDVYEQRRNNFPDLFLSLPACRALVFSMQCMARKPLERSLAVDMSSQGID